MRVSANFGRCLDYMIVCVVYLGVREKNFGASNKKILRRGRFRKVGKVSSTCRNRSDDVAIYIRLVKQLPGLSLPAVSERRVSLLPVEMPLSLLFASPQGNERGADLGFEPMQRNHRLGSRCTISSGNYAARMTHRAKRPSY